MIGWTGYYAINAKNVLDLFACYVCYTSPRCVWCRRVDVVALLRFYTTDPDGSHAYRSLLHRARAHCLQIAVFQPFARSLQQISIDQNAVLKRAHFGLTPADLHLRMEVFALRTHEVTPVLDLVHETRHSSVFRPAACVRHDGRFALDHRGIVVGVVGVVVVGVVVGVVVVVVRRLGVVDDVVRLAAVAAGVVDVGLAIGPDGVVFLVVWLACLV